MRALVLAGVAAVVGGLVFLPPFLSADASLAFAQNDVATSSPLVQVGRFLVKDLYFVGPFAAVVLVVALPALVRAALGARTDWLVRLGLLTIAVSQVLFLRFPWKMGHLLPTLVGLALLAARALGDRPRLLAALVATQLLYAVVSIQLVAPDNPNAATGGELTFRPRWGALVVDTQCRQDDPGAWRGTAGARPRRTPGPPPGGVGLRQALGGVTGLRRRPRGELRGHRGHERRQEPVEGGPGAPDRRHVGRPGVAVTVHRVGQHPPADPHRLALRVDVVGPAQRRAHLDDRRLGGGGGQRIVEVAQHGHADRAVVGPEGVGPDHHGAGGPPRVDGAPSDEHLAVGPHRQVVADVVPPPVDHVEPLEGAHGGAGVEVVRRVGVVHHHGPGAHLLVGLVAPERLVGAPAGAIDDLSRHQVGEGHVHHGTRSWHTPPR